MKRNKLFTLIAILVVAGIVCLGIVIKSFPGIAYLVATVIDDSRIFHRHEDTIEYQYEQMDLYDEGWILGKTKEEISERYDFAGDWSGYDNEGARYEFRAFFGWPICDEEGRRIQGHYTDPEYLYYVIEFDEDGYAVSCDVESLVPPGG